MSSTIDVLPLRTRDGHVSYAAFEDRRRSQRSEEIMSMRDALEWARRCKVPLSGSRAADIEAINEARRGYSLPEYQIVG